MHIVSMCASLRLLAEWEDALLREELTLPVNMRLLQARDLRWELVHFGLLHVILVCVTKLHTIVRSRILEAVAPPKMMLNVNLAELEETVRNLRKHCNYKKVFINKKLNIV